MVCRLLRGQTGGNGELKKVLPQAGAKVRKDIIGEEEAAELLSCPQDLTPSRPPPSRVGSREVKELQGTIQRSLEASLTSALAGPNRPLDLAPDVRHLLHQREARPAPRGRLRVNRRSGIRHSVTSAFTTRRIESFTSGFSTSRDRLPWLGRTLIIESYSIHSDSDSSG